MSKAVLPNALHEFFKATERDLDDLYKPVWLLSELDEPVWMISGSADMREVLGETKGATLLRWDKALWNGTLTDSVFEKVLYQARLITVLAFDNNFHKLGDTLKTIVGFHAFVFRVIEFLDFKYGRLFHVQGFKVLTSEDIGEMLELSLESGVCGTGFWIDRLQMVIRRNLGENTSHGDIVKYFKSIDAYNRDGTISTIKIGRMINVEPRRLSKSIGFMRHLAMFECSRSEVFNKEIAQKTVSQIATWFAIFARILALSPIDTCAELDDEYAIRDLIKPFRSPIVGRTKSMPRKTARALIRECCVWMENFPAVQEYIRKVIDTAIGLNRTGAPLLAYDALVAAESQNLVPASLNRISSFLGGSDCSSDSPGEHFLAPTFLIKLTRFHSAVCFVLVALLSCSRRREVIEVGLNDIFDKSGYKYLNISLRKTGVDDVRVKFAKPVPELLYSVIESLESLKLSWLKFFPSEDPLVVTRSFFKVSYKGIAPLAANDVYPLLAVLGEYSELVDKYGKPWVILPHQLRRYFALTFFHDEGAENSLPALTWFMGHGDIEGTWRYIKESLTGKEVSASEAAMATSAICSGDESEGAVRLRKVLYDHFGCSNISLMDEDEVQDYLELLSEQGIFSATPIQIGSGGKRRVSVMISIREAKCQGLKKAK